MSFARRLIHPLTVVHVPLDDSVDARDEYGQPVPLEAVRTPVRGLIQPRSAREAAHTLDEGAELADHVIFLLPMGLSGSDGIEDADGNRYDVKGIRRYEFGRSPHLEVDARRVIVAEPVAVAS